MHYRVPGADFPFSSANNGATKCPIDSPRWRCALRQQRGKQTVFGSGRGRCLSATNAIYSISKCDKNASLLLHICNFFLRSYVRAVLFRFYFAHSVYPSVPCLHTHTQHRDSGWLACVRIVWLCREWDMQHIRAKLARCRAGYMHLEEGMRW